MRAAPFHGQPLFEDDAAAIAVLYEFTGQQFGDDAAHGANGCDQIVSCIHVNMWRAYGRL